MKKFIAISAVLMALMSCEKAFNIDLGDNDEDEKVEAIEFTNTITYNGKSYPITELEIEVEKGEMNDIGYEDDVFIVSAYAKIQGKNSSVAYEGMTIEGYAYEQYFICGYIPTDNYGKMYSLLDKETKGLFGFGTSEFFEGRVGQGTYTYQGKDADYVLYGYAFGNRGYLNEDGNIINKKTPKRLNYYINVEHTYKEDYCVYVDYEDADGNRYILSYKGEKNL